MSDREKIIEKALKRTPIEGLEWVLEDDRFGFGENWEIDSEPQTEEEQAGYYIQRAIDLLKEQEAVEPEVEVLNEIDRLYRCPKCHKCFFYEKQKYCDKCGQAVKWG